MKEALISICVGALIGWVTNYLAVLMLFRPHKEIKIFGINFQGVFPKRQKALAEKISDVVARDLLSNEEITNALTSSVDNKSMLALLDSQIEKLITEKVPVVAPMFAFVLNSELVAKIKGVFLPEMETVLTGIKEDVLGKFNKNLDIKETVKSKIESFSSEKLETLLLEVMKKEFKLIEIVGGVLGGIIGGVQILI